MILVNNTFQETENFSEKIFNNGLSIYEVIRIFNGHPIFLKDNIQRLDNSLKKSGFHIDVNSLDIPDKLKRYIASEHISEGNLKYVLHFTTNQTDEYLFQTPHCYPTLQDYKQGVPTLTYCAIRENPEVKYINADLRTKTNQLIHDNQVYEILLVDRERYITEGSRSNIFFIKNDKLYTSPLKYVLPGTSLKRVFRICQNQGYSLCEKRIALDSITDYDAAFLTGTSPLILPINRINTLTFNVENLFLRQLMKHYFALLEEE